MAEADDQPKRCPCGFWGSASTMNLCSQCYKEHIKTHSQNSSDSNANNKSTATSSLLTGLLANIPGSSSSITPMEEEAINNENNQKKEPSLENMEVEEKNEMAAPTVVETPIQKNKRKCWTCRVKLELAQRELGQCKCGYVFCLLHRLPEQHGCTYDHKDSGRQEAMKNMVDTGRKKIGRSFHRMDSKA